MKSFLLLFSIIPFFIFGQNIPKIGNDTLLEVGAWNIEWFGDTGYGPTDETLQFNNVKAVIEKTDLDVLALEEMFPGKQIPWMGWRALQKRWVLFLLCNSVLDPDSSGAVSGSGSVFGIRIPDPDPGQSK